MEAGSSCDAEDNWDCDGGGEESMGGVEVAATSSDWLSRGGEKLDTTSVFADWNWTIIWLTAAQVFFYIQENIEENLRYFLPQQQEFVGQDFLFQIVGLPTVQFSQC